MTDADSPVIPLPKTVICRNLRCSGPFLPRRAGQLFCCPACKVQWKNLVRAACTEAAELLIEHRMQPRESKSKRAKQIARAKELGKPMPPKAKRGLLTKALRVVDQFISAERMIRDKPELAETMPRPYRWRE